MIKKIIFSTLILLVFLFCGCGKMWDQANRRADAETGTETERSILSGEIKSATNEKERPIFELSVGDFANRFNSVWKESDSEKDYLRPSDEWQSFNDGVPFRGYSAVRYFFSADGRIRSLPTISVYVPRGDDAETQNEIYEIMLTFDDHGYTESFFELYKRMCICALKMFLPSETSEKLEEIFSDACAASGDNVLTDYKSDCEPIFSSESVDVYAFYGAGTVNICLLPVTAKSS